MNSDELIALIASGEDSTRQFKADIRNSDSLASEMAAFANSEGGALFIGVSDAGAVPGLSQADVVRINQLISNAASQGVRSPLIVQTENVLLPNGRVVIVLGVPKGLARPYFDKNGVIWLKTGADKRRINSREELRRIFQISDQLHGDELPTRAEVEQIDKLRFRDFLRDVYQIAYPENKAELIRLLQNMSLATAEGKLNLAGVLLFAERPEWIKPEFVVKGVRYPGKEIHISEYLDTEDFAGPLPKVYADALAFIMRNLFKVQAGRGVNAPGIPEIPAAVFEELLVNALIHRDYLVSAPIRLFIFDNRIEIISPGNLPNNLTVEKIRSGISNLRNPVLVSFAAKGLLPYHGLGSGIKRALENWPDIDFNDDRVGTLFKATIYRKTSDTHEPSGSSFISADSPISSVKELDIDKSSGKSSGNRAINDKSTGKESGKSSGKKPASDKSSGRTSERIVYLLSGSPKMTIPELALALGITTRAVEKQIAQLRKLGRLQRIGSHRDGYWHVAEQD